MRAPRSGIEAKDQKKITSPRRLIKFFGEVPSAVRRAIRVRAKNDGF
jgi:hypothetical protein